MTSANTELQLLTTLQIYNNFIDPQFSFSPFDELCDGLSKNNAFNNISICHTYIATFMRLQKEM